MSEEVAMMPEAITQLLSTFGTLGVLVWYLWYNESRVRPESEKRDAEARVDYLQALERISVRHSEALAKLAEEVIEIKLGLPLICQAHLRCENYRPKGDM